MKKILAVIIGIQGSGKSTFYHRYLAEEYVRINLDTLKTRHQEQLLVDDCIRQGKCFAVDNTNPTKADRERYIIPAKAAGYRIVGYFMESKLKVCIERNNQRTGKEKIPAVAIAATSNKLQMPSYDEGFDELYFVKNDGETMTVLEWSEEYK
ncbi:MAG: AAA family ATPase [Monoglobaceae bacterium]